MRHTFINLITDASRVSFSTAIGLASLGSIIIGLDLFVNGFNLLAVGFSVCLLSGVIFRGLLLSKKKKGVY